ncbi:MAG: hypothetical protein GC155_01460 [Alphaproteobacteria bacterium]|nr:hypothetical protein [Alphaproteobacteria bacterium]
MADDPLSTPPPPGSPPPDPSASEHPVPVIDARREGGVWTAEPHPLDAQYEDHPHQRSIREKMFDITAWGWIKLAGLCLAVGALLRVADINPFSPGFTLGGALASLAKAVGDIAAWAVVYGWLPALLGVIVVMPIWLLWRLLSVPFRR